MVPGPVDRFKNILFIIPSGTDPIFFYIVFSFMFGDAPPSESLWDFLSFLDAEWDLVFDLFLYYGDPDCRDLLNVCKCFLLNIANVGFYAFNISLKTSLSF